MEIISSDKKKYSIEENNETIKRNKIQTRNIRNEHIYSNIKKKEFIKNNKTGKNNHNWKITNKTIKENEMNNEREKNDLNIKNFQKNMLDNGRKFRGEMSIENNSIELKNDKKILILIYYYHQIIYNFIKI